MTLSIYTGFVSMMTAAMSATGNIYTIVQIEQKASPAFPFAIVGRSTRTYGLVVNGGNFQVELYEKYDTTLGTDVYSTEAANRDAIETNYDNLIQALQALQLQAMVPEYIVWPTYSLEKSDVGWYGPSTLNSPYNARVARFTVNFGLREG